MSAGVPKIADFGFAMTPNSPPMLPNVNVGSPLYMSPQALKSNRYSDKSDIWAIGVSAYELLLGTLYDIYCLRLGSMVSSKWKGTCSKDAYLASLIHKYILN